MFPKIHHKLRKNANYLYAFGIALSLWLLFTGGSPQQDHILAAIDDYSANVLKYHQQGPVKFSWRQFLSLDRYFVEHASQVQALTCEAFANSIGKTQTTFYNCRDHPENKLVPIRLYQNVNLYVGAVYRAMFGKIYMYNTFPNPTQLVYLFHDNILSVPVESAAEALPLKLTDLGGQIGKLTEYKPALSERKPVKLAYEDFNYKENIKKYESGVVRELHDKYKDTKRAKRYFSEAFLVEYPGDFILDWRFFNSTNILDKDVQYKTQKLSNLMRTWLNLCSKIGINSWLVDTNVIGWKFNGLHVPFEKEFNFQLTIKDLLKLIDLGYNHSVIFDYSDYDKKVKQTLFLDISPFFKLRDKNNGENINEVRLVDIETGLFIQATAVTTFAYEKLYNYEQKPIWQSLKAKDETRIKKYIKTYKDSKENLLSTKDIEVFKFDDVETLLPVVFENQIAYLPKGYVNILTDKYFQPFVSSKYGYKFRSSLNLWVSMETCLSNEEECLKNKDVKYFYEVYKKSTQQHQAYLAAELDLLVPQDLGGFAWWDF